MQQYSQLMTEHTGDRTIDQLQKADELIQSAQTLFTELKAHSGNAQKLGYDPQIAGQREKYCEFVRKNVQRRLTQQKANEELKQDKLDELRRARQQEEEERLKQLKEEADRQRDMEERLVLQRKELQQKLLEEQQEKAVANRQERESKVGRSFHTRAFIIVCRNVRRSARRRRKNLLRMTSRKSKRLLLWV
jgi:hypothetical protein